MSLSTATRPPRPLIPPAELLAKAKAHGMAVQNIRAAWTTPDGDTVIETDTGIRERIVDPTNPDGAGLSGVLLEHHPKGYKLAHVPDFTPRSSRVSGDAWTVADLEWLAAKLIVPSTGEGIEDGWSGYRSWLMGGDNDVPVRAYALWKSEAEGRMQGVTLTEAARRSKLCAALRHEILASGWLAEDEAAKL